MIGAKIDAVRWRRLKRARRIDSFAGCFVQLAISGGAGGGGVGGTTTTVDVVVEGSGYCASAPATTAATAIPAISAMKIRFKEGSRGSSDAALSHPGAQRASLKCV